jgi:hypothetical protein
VTRRRGPPSCAARLLPAASGRVARAVDLGFKEVLAYTLAAFVRLCLLEADPARAAHLAGIADRLLEEAGVRLQPSEEAPFEQAAAEQELGDEYPAVHDAAMAEPLEEALRRGNVLAEVTGS